MPRNELPVTDEDRNEDMNDGIPLHPQTRTELPIIDEESRSQIEYMTGRIPLFLSPLFNFSGQKFKDIATSYWELDTLKRPQEEIIDFSDEYQANNKDSYPYVLINCLYEN
jgi:hypothetical protein